jgi:polyisoprenoid-binding protein YceI
MTKWSIDDKHSEIGFKVKHMMVTNVHGRFLEFEGNAEIDEDNFINSSFTFTANVDSINTGISDRDKHLKTTDFFNTKEYPTLTFKSTSITETDVNTYRIVGELTIREITNTITLNAEYDGATLIDPWGSTKRGLSATGKINRKDWGLTWNNTLNSGGLLVGEDVNLNLEVQFVKQ